MKKYVNIAETPFPPNCLAWIGASLVGSLNNEVDRFLLEPEEYKQKGKVDRFGDTFLLFNKEGDYFNKTFEEAHKEKKRVLYQSTTPYSARSLATRSVMEGISES